MSLLSTREATASTMVEKFNEELDFMIKNDLLEQGLASLVLFGEEYTLEEEFEATKELKAIDEDKVSWITEETLSEAVNAEIPNFKDVSSVEAATAKIKALTNQLNQKLREQQNAIASKKGWYATIILNLKRAITWLKDKIASGFFKAKNAVTGAFSKDRKLANAKNDWKRANNQYNNVIQRL